MITTIHLNRVRIYAFHGCMEAEQRVGNYFEIDVDLNVDAEKAMISDNLSDALNYVEVYDIINREMQIKSKLLENVAYRIVKSIRENFSADILKGGRLKIAKMNPPIGEIEKVAFEVNF